mmetsp:Transcript_24968/g.73318  ORF Transcript_24968/g.73318 Transcript_24968/m.73318 type:complete len:432 (+) Transcript_24968:66-1361(+)
MTSTEPRLLARSCVPGCRHGSPCSAPQVQFELVLMIPVSPMRSRGPEDPLWPRRPGRAVAAALAPGRWSYGAVDALVASPVLPALVRRAAHAHAPSRARAGDAAVALLENATSDAASALPRVLGICDEAARERTHAGRSGAGSGSGMSGFADGWPAQSVALALALLRTALWRLQPLEGESPPKVPTAVLVRAISAHLRHEHGDVRAAAVQAAAALRVVSEESFAQIAATAPHAMTEPLRVAATLAVDAAAQARAELVALSARDEGASAAAKSDTLARHTPESSVIGPGAVDAAPATAPATSLPLERGHAATENAGDGLPAASPRALSHTRPTGQGSAIAPPPPSRPAATKPVSAGSSGSMDAPNADGTVTAPRAAPSGDTGAAVATRHIIAEAAAEAVTQQSDSAVLRYMDAGGGAANGAAGPPRPPPQVS